MSNAAWLALGLAVVTSFPARTVTAQAVGRASPAALASARSKESSMRQTPGPESVTLTPDEMASLIEANLDAQARRTIDSIRIRLQPGRLMLQAVIVTSAIGDVLGPMTMMMDSTEPLAVAGPARAAKAGLITWEPDSVVIRSFSFPQAAIPRLVGRLTGTADGSIPIAVPPNVRRIWITPAGVTFSRKAG
jgi:hypothetical protein